MTEDTNGLSREHVEARLADALLQARDVNLPFDDPLDVSIRDVVRAQTDTVAALLAEARAEVDSRIRKAILQSHVRASTEYGPDYCATCSEAIHDWVRWPCAATEPARAEVVRDVEAWAQRLPRQWAQRLRAEVLARYMPAAVREGGTERLPASGDSDGPPGRERPSGGRTGPQDWFCNYCGGMTDHLSSGHTTCGEALGDMRCQLRRGHDGGHEDYRGVAQERRG